MSIAPAFDDSSFLLYEPTERNIKQWLAGIIKMSGPHEKARWREAQIDSCFYAGSGDFSRMRRASPANEQFYFNLVKTPVELITGYQRSHRKSPNFIPTKNADTKTTDQYTRLISEEFNRNSLNEVYSRACELAAVSGMVLLQPYLDFAEDPAQGELRLKLWEFNSFLIDHTFRDIERLSDCNYVLCQEYVNKAEAIARFPEHENEIRGMQLHRNEASFYFLPEASTLNASSQLVITYAWYRKRRKKKMLYSRNRAEFFRGGKNIDFDALLQEIPDTEVVDVPANAWNLCIVLNDRVMWSGEDPLGLANAPVVPVVWNYDPHLNRPDLRVRSMVYPIRSAQYLFNRRVVLNHEISESSINTGWKRKAGAVANEDNLKMTGQGVDIVINHDYNMTDVEKIIPNAVPPSDIDLATQMKELALATSGINVENWSAQEDGNVSTLTTMVKQAANLLVFQKFFDQWDGALKQVSEKLLEIVINHWSPQKVALLLGEEPTPFFYYRIFAHYRTVIAEGLDTATQKQQEFAQWLELNQLTGGVIPPSEIAKRATIQGKDELAKLLQEQEKTQAEMQMQQNQIALVLEQAKIKELYSKSAANVGLARERYGRDEANIGLFQERLSEISHNRSMSLKAKTEAMEKLLQMKELYGELNVMLANSELDAQNQEMSAREDFEQEQAKREQRKNAISLHLTNSLKSGINAPKGSEFQQQGAF